MSKSSFLAALERRNVYSVAVFYMRPARLLAQIATQGIGFFHVRIETRLDVLATRIYGSAKQPEAVSPP
jgi:hypothetical protein